MQHARLGNQPTRRPVLTSDRAIFFATFVPVLAIYLATASWTALKTPDAYTNMATAWSLANTGSLYLDEYDDLLEYSGQLAWIATSVDGRTVSMYPPATALHAAPLYLVWGGDGQVRSGGDRGRYPDGVPFPALGPGALVGATSTAVAVALVATATRRHVGVPVALAGAGLFAFGTSALTIAADDLWQHGPAMMWALLAVYLASIHKYPASGAAFAIAILVRPPVAAIAVCVALAIAVKQRRLRPALVIGSMSMIAVVLLVAYNLTVFGSIGSAYTDHFAGNLASTDIAAYGANVVGGLFHPRFGVLTWSSFVIVAAAGVVCLRRSIPPALLGAAIGAIAYVLVAWKTEHFSGGGGFVGYRYPLEAIAVAAPAMILSWRWIRERVWAQRTLLVTAAFSVALFVGSEFITAFWIDL